VNLHWIRLNSRQAIFLISAIVTVIFLALHFIIEKGRDVPRSEYAVISAYYNNLKINVDSLACKFMVIVDSTDTVQFAGNAKLARPATRDSFTIEKSTLDDFNTKNKKRFFLGRFFRFKIPCTHMRSAELDTIFDRNRWEACEKAASTRAEWMACTGEWSEFYKRYPCSCGYKAFSRVGFNKAGDRALFHVRGAAGELAGGRYFVYMKKENGHWVEVTMIQEGVY
jgi:hypothetical protein